MSEEKNPEFRDRYIDPFDHDLEIYVRDAVATLRRKGLPPMHIIEILSNSRPPIDENQVSWNSCEKLIFLELKRQIYRSVFGDICPF